jgi:phage-related protein
MAAVGAGVREIRVKDSAGAFRAIYLATPPGGIYVLHCFQKKAQQTVRRDIELARRRLKAIAR